MDRMWVFRWTFSSISFFSRPLTFSIHKLSQHSVDHGSVLIKPHMDIWHYIKFSIYGFNSVSCAKSAGNGEICEEVGVIWQTEDELESRLHSISIDNFQ